MHQYRPPTDEEIAAAMKVSWAGIIFSIVIVSVLILLMIVFTVMSFKGKLKPRTNIPSFSNPFSRKGKDIEMQVDGPCGENVYDASPRQPRIPKAVKQDSVTKKGGEVLKSWLRKSSEMLKSLNPKGLHVDTSLAAGHRAFTPEVEATHGDGNFHTIPLTPDGETARGFHVPRHAPEATPRAPPAATVRADPPSPLVESEISELSTPDPVSPLSVIDGVDEHPEAPAWEVSSLKGSSAPK
ncbi:hypothetical protein B0T16DRAFT_392175 [Cercophora newfieldiana]|uniref:Uncharacterized protein n=1 Tax=Cercophora newfieldiana TaxID=92897 RepID=A0AA39Y2I3_9PEZI|nr:hypothetical protein B0T16DRAFT_392175 [Cercophora newfieldiana]